MNFYSDLEKRSDDRWRKSAREIGRFIDDYIARLATRGNRGNESSEMTLVAASPASPVAFAVAQKAERLAAEGASLRFIFSISNQDDGIRAFFAAVNGIVEGMVASDCSRWARNAALHDAHEQLVLGRNMAWNGDVLRRALPGSNAVDIFTIDADDGATFGRLSFEALWQASDILPGSNRFVEASSVEGLDPAIYGEALSALAKDDKIQPVH